MKISCKNCIFAESLGIPKGSDYHEWVCHRYPPASFIDKTETFPHVFTYKNNEENDWWCGEFKTKEVIL